MFHNPLCHAVELVVSQRNKVGRVRASDGVEAVGNCGDRVGILVEHAVNSGQHARLCPSCSCAPLVADLFLFCYERDFMLSLSENNQSGVIEAFNSTSRYLDDLLNIDNKSFDSMVNRIYLSELQLNKANVSDAEASFLHLDLSISDGFVKTKIL